jgi:heparanase 1
VRLPLQEVAEDFLRLSGLLHEIWGPAQAVPKVIGPDNTLDEEWFHEFLTIVGPALNAVTIHLYNLGPGNNLSLPYTILNPNHDAVTIETAANLSRMTATTGHQDMWVGEDGGAYNSGQNQTTNRFISAFWSLTELGTFARAGFKVYCRQTFLGGNYGLVDKDTLKPNPDFFAFLLFKRLMGPTALDVGIQSGEPYVKVFAHCARGVSGGVTLLMLNFDGAREFRISGPTSLLGSGPRHEYLMASPGIVNGTVAYLNGQPLVISDAGAYPKLEPVIKATSDPVVIPPHSYSFTVFPDAKVAACA